MEESKQTPKFKVGDKVTFINDYGVSFPHKTITEVILNPPSLPHVPIAYGVTPTDAPWFPIDEKKLFIEYNQD